MQTASEPLISLYPSLSLLSLIFICENVELSLFTDSFIKILLLEKMSKHLKWFRLKTKRCDLKWTYWWFIYFFISSLFAILCMSKHSPFLILLLYLNPQSSCHTNKKLFRYDFGPFILADLLQVDADCVPQYSNVCFVGCCVEWIARYIKIQTSSGPVLLYYMLLVILAKVMMMGLRGDG